MRCLNIKVIYDCNNACPFCFGSALREVKLSTAGILRAVETGYAQGCRSLVLSGGEPTLAPAVAMEALQRAWSLGYESFTLQTNGSGLADECHLGRLLSRISSDRKLSISFSVHGPTAEIHDSICARKGAFVDLIAAMKRVAGNTEATILTNSVITRPNMDHLSAIAETLSPFRVSTMQFAVMHAKGLDALAAGLIRSSEAVRSLARDVDREILRTEGIPFCMMRGLEECVGESYWPRELDLFNRDGDYRSSFDQLAEGMRAKLLACADCIMDPICHGVWSEHSEELAEHANPIC